MKKLKLDIRIKPLSPVHIGVGNSFLPRSTYHLYSDGPADYLALFRTRALFEALLDHFGGQIRNQAQLQRMLEQDDYPLEVRHAIESGPLALRRIRIETGAEEHLRGRGKNDGLKEIVALSNGVPYIPGSSVKGALRTMWLDWQSQQDGAYERVLHDVQRAEFRKKTSADDPMMERMQVAQSMQGVDSRTQPQNRDLFRAVQVSDLVPEEASDNLTAAFAVQAMSYQARSHPRQAFGGKARAQAWECLDPSAGISYRGTVTVDLGLLVRLQAQDPDARNLKAALGKAEQWQAALQGYAERVQKGEDLHYGVLENLNPDKGIDIEDLLDFVFMKDEEIGHQLFPLGMGVGLQTHSILGALAPQTKVDADVLALGDENLQHRETLFRQVLQQYKNAPPPQQYAEPDFPRPKSRRVTGEFGGRNAANMRADRPLGWTQLLMSEAQA